MIIDAHTHIFPPRVLANRKRFLEGEPFFAGIYSDPKAPLVDAQGLIRAMDADAVDISWALGFPWVRAENARMHNDYLAQAQAESSGRLRGLACVHPPADWAQAEADAPLLLHTNEPVGHKYPGKAPMTLAALYGLVRRHPETKLVLAHMAGGLFFYSLLKKEVSQAVRNVWIDTAAAPFLYQPRAYGLAVELLGADKVLLGSDYPLLPVSRYQREMQDPRAGLGDGALEMVMGRAALELIP
jgi:predicted TIM-barrel fold metal-dependent hydrolase